MQLRAIQSAAVAAIALFAWTTPANAATTVTDWEMNETSGTTMVDSTGTNDGTLHDVAVNGSYYTFNGVDSLATATQSFTIGAADISFTAALRFTQIPNSTVGDYDIVRGAPTGKWKLEIVRRKNGTQAKANCHFAGTNGGTQLAAGPSLADGAWHTVTCAKTTSSIALTVDGKTYTKSFTAGSIDTTGKEIALGGQAAGADQFAGDLDYVQIAVG